MARATGGATGIGPQLGTYLGRLELICRFDPLLSEHLAKCKTRTGEIPMPCPLFIQLMAEKVLRAVVKEFKDEFKVFLHHGSLNTTHVDQLT